MTTATAYAARLDELLRAGRGRPIVDAAHDLLDRSWTDQAAAAANQLQQGWRRLADGGGPPGTRYTAAPINAWPEWLTLQILTVLTRWACDELDTCVHAPNAAHPRPIYACAWRPDLVTCGRCTHLLMPPPGSPEAHRCDGCGRITQPNTDDGITTHVIVAGVLCWTVGVCPACAWRPTP